jgi:hypothetical protein
MINFIKKIFSIFEGHPDKKRKSSKGIVGTQGTSWSQSCTCCFCQPIETIIPPSPSQLKRDLKECKRNINVGLVSTQEDLKELINFMEKQNNLKKCSREATEDELKNESMFCNEIKLFEICGDSVVYHNAASNSIKTYTKRGFKSFQWGIVEDSVEIDGVMHHYKLQNGYMGSISIYFYTKENAEKYLKAILQFIKDNIPQTHCYCENLIKK